MKSKVVEVPYDSGGIIWTNQADRLSLAVK